jgi:hypothetical protein
MALRRLPEIRDTVRQLEKEIEKLQSRLAVHEQPGESTAA